MEIQSTIRTPPVVLPKRDKTTTNPGAFIADMSGNSVWIPQTGMDPELRSLMYNTLPTSFVGAFSKLAKDRAEARGIKPTAALPFDLIAVGIANQELFAKAHSGNLTVRDGFSAGGMACSVGAAISSAMGQTGAENLFSLGKEILVGIAECEGEFFWLDQPLDGLSAMNERPYWDQLADQTSVVGTEIT